jgi:hypothetical protein
MDKPSDYGSDIRGSNPLRGTKPLSYKKIITMNKNVVLLVFMILAFTHCLYSQKLSNIDFDDIKTKTTDSTSEFYYPKLYVKFNMDVIGLMSKEKLKMFYYGYVFTKDYNPMGPNPEEEKLMYNYYKKKDFENAILIGKKILEKDPTNLSYNYRTMLCYANLDDTLNLQEYTNRYVFLKETVYASGDGKSIKTAYIVTRVSDEYQILDSKKLEMESQALIGECDLLTIKQPNEKNIDKLYFNVKFSLDYLDNMIEKNNK